MGRRCKHAAEIPAEAKVPVRLVVGFTLLPHHEQRRSRAIFPAQHVGGPERADVEVGAAAVGVGTIAVLILLRPAVDQLLVVRIVAGRDEGFRIHLQRQVRRHRVVEAGVERHGLLIDPSEHVALAATLEILVHNPLRIVVIDRVAQAEIERHRRGRAPIHARVDVVPGAVLGVGPMAAVVIERQRLAVVGVRVIPEVLAGIAEHARTAARHAVAERRRVEIKAAADAVVVGERPVRVDVAARIGAVAAKVPARVLVDVEVARAHILPGFEIAPLEPVRLAALVGAAHEAEVVAVEARRLVADI